MVVIAHRLHSIVHADQICVMQDGHIAACGTHDQLLESCAEYRRLWQAAEGSAQWKVSTDKGAELLVIVYRLNTIRHAE